MTIVDTALDTAADVSAAAAAYVDSLDHVQDSADALCRAEGRYLAAVNVAGIHDARPCVRELAAEALHGRAQALRPYVPLVTLERAERSAEALTGWQPPEELTALVLAESSPRGFAERMLAADRATCADLAASVGKEWSR